jgi:hypothetical protein
MFRIFTVWILGAACAAAAPVPRIFYSDLESGPNAGGQNNNGAFVTIFGAHFGSAHGDSYVTIGGGRACAYLIWTDNKIAFQLGRAAQSGDIMVTTAAGNSNGVPFTVRRGNIFFVSPGGTDGHKGGLAAPWRSLVHAIHTMNPGDIVYGMDGASQITDDGEGWNAALTLRIQWCDPASARSLLAYPGATVIIGNIDGKPDSAIRSVGGGGSTPPCNGGWLFAGLQLRGLASVALGGPSTNWRFVANDITCPQGDGPSGCVETGQASNLKMLGNNVHDTGKPNASALYHGVYFSTDSNHIEMGWNTVANVHGCRGVQVHSTAESAGTGLNQFDLSFHDNLIHDTQCDGIVLYTVDPSKGKVELYNNVIYNAGKGPANPEGTGNWSCIYVAGGTNRGPAGGGTVELYNNTLVNCGTFARPPWGNANNAVDNGGHNPDLKIRLRNNIIVQPRGVSYLAGTRGSIIGTNNLFFGDGSAPSALEESVGADPLFVDAAKSDFHLQAGSPARSRCREPLTSLDREGTARSVPCDLGAYQFAK